MATSALATEPATTELATREPLYGLGNKAEIWFDTPYSQHFPDKNRFWRPEWQTTRRCSTNAENSCEPCYGYRTGAECWTAAEMRKGHHHYGRVVHSNGNGTWFKYTNNIHLLCDSSRVKIFWRDPIAHNGVLAMYWDGKEINKANFPSLKAWSQGAHELTFVLIKNDRMGAHEFHMVFTPYAPVATAKLDHLRFYTTLTFAMCEDTKACLKTLEEHDEDGMLLRMDNKKQLECLESSGSDTIGVACEAWLACLAENRQSILSMLQAAGTNEASDVVVPDSDSPECIRPEFADPESWTCDCYEEAKDACSLVGVAHTEVQCLRAHFCNREEVCGSWKFRFCTKDLESLQAELSSHSERALLQHAARSYDQSDENGLDGTLTSKSCA